MIGRFFHTPGAKQFRYKPRFFNPDKEELDDRVKKIKEEMGIVEEKKDGGKPYVSNIKGQFRNSDGWQAKSGEDARRAQNKRLIWIVLVLALAITMYLFPEFFSF